MVDQNLSWNLMDRNSRHLQIRRQNFLSRCDFDVRNFRHRSFSCSKTCLSFSLFFFSFLFFN